jgi:polyribonucleotide nucleotidyltransferase
MLHYNFPPFSTGETKPMRGPGRREVGHGALAERAVTRLLPGHEDFPYTIRIVSEILESNGSSSMASVCGASLSLMDCGVPIRKPVAGIAMGLITEGGKVAILSDILGDEDHLGDMDFKVCGTDKGITAIQMDIKIEGLERRVLEQALEQARAGRIHILGKMAETLTVPRVEINRWAPRITTVKVKPDQIRIIIGPGGKTIKGIIDQTGCSVDVNDDGTVAVASADSDAVKRAIQIIEGLTAEPEVGRIYQGTIKRLVDFGAFVEILPNNEALLHVSEIAHERIENPADVLKEGDEIEVKVISVERDGKVRLTRRELLPFPEGDLGEQAKERIARAREQGGVWSCARATPVSGLSRRTSGRSRRGWLIMMRGYSRRSWSRRRCWLVAGKRRRMRRKRARQRKQPRVPAESLLTAAPARRTVVRSPPPLLMTAARCTAAATVGRTRAPSQWERPAPNRARQRRQ